ncbi:MAG: hypothetical protein HYS40_06130, partial [Gemmatimonadetes bacterium]|nr:hypothetical protein [Gemmatimonadota bacterium]
VEVERAILRYDFSDRVKLSAGRYHTPLGYWNTAFHHGQWLQTTVARPELIKFGGRFLPVHFVGVMAEGTVPLGAVDLRYALGAGNGRHTNIARGGDAGDVNDRRAWTAAVRSRLRSVPLLEVGAALYLDRVNPVAAVAVNERLLAAHVVWDGQQPEVLAEYVHARHAVAGGGPRAVSDAGYIQVAYRLAGRAKVLKPYARAERIDVPTGDPLLGALGLNYRALIAGLRYDFAPIAALKLEYRAEKPASPSWFDTFVAQLSFTFPGWQEEGPPRPWSDVGPAASRGSWRWR